MEKKELDNFKNFVKDLNKRDWELQTKEVQELMKEFVDIATSNNFTVQQICDCMQYLPACDISLIVSLFPDNISIDLDKTMFEMYTTNFKNLVDGKKDVTKFVSFTKYKTDVLAGKISRLITISEMFYIMGGLKENPIVLLMDKPCDNKYVIELKKYHAERKNVKTRNREYAIVNELKPILLKDCVASAKSKIQEHSI